MTLDKILEVYKQIETKNDVMQLLRDYDIHLFFQDLQVPSRLFIYDGYASIIVRKTLVQPDYYILHEIAHHIMHKDQVGSKFGYGKAEFEANMFACIYLLQGDLLDEHYEHTLLAYGVPSKDIERYRDTLHQYLIEQMNKSATTYSENFKTLHTL